MALHASPLALKELQELLHFSYDTLLAKVRTATSHAVIHLKVVDRFSCSLYLVCVPVHVALRA